jgi:hypothetical protein
LLTGTTADKVKAAALAAQPGATVIRVETDSAGSPYEAHLRTSAGKDVTVKVDASFKVTATEDGFGGRGPGHDGHDGHDARGRLQGPDSSTMVGPGAVAAEGKRARTGHGRGSSRVGPASPQQKVDMPEWRDHLFS